MPLSGELKEVGHALVGRRVGQFHCYIDTYTPHRAGSCLKMCALYSNYCTFNTIIMKTSPTVHHDQCTLPNVTLVHDL